MGVPCRNGYPESTTGDTPTHRCHDPPPRPAPAGFVRPWCALGGFPAAVATTESTTGTPTRALTRHDPRPLPPGVHPPRVCSRCCPHLHHGLPVSPTPTPGSRRGSRTYFTYCHQMKHEDK